MQITNSRFSKFILYGIALLFFQLLEAARDQVIVNALSHDRFGDKIIEYCIAKYFSLLYQIPLCFKSFEGSEKLNMSMYEEKYDMNIEKKYPHKILVRSENEIASNLYPGTMFMIELEMPIIPLQKINAVLYRPTEPDPIFKKMQENKEFATKIRKMIAPIHPFMNLTLPKDSITVAVHVRKGSYHDLDLGPLTSEQIFNKTKFGIDFYAPTKFPPEQFYIDQIKRLLALFKSSKFFIHIFTDDNNPEQIVQRFRHCINSDNVEFSYFHSNHYWHDTFVEDYYAMSQFDILIRPNSHLSGVSQLLGHHKLILWPNSCAWEANRLYILETAIFIPINQTDSVMEACIFENLGPEKIQQLCTIVTHQCQDNFSQKI